MTETALLSDAETATTWQTVTTNTFTNNATSWRIGQLDQRVGEALPQWGHERRR